MKKYKFYNFLILTIKSSNKVVKFYCQIVTFKVKFTFNCANIFSTVQNVVYIYN